MPLIVVPTPVGNMEDITLRALRELRKADWIGCEDTRRTGLLLKRYSIKGRLFSCHQHNEHDRIAIVLSRMEEGLRVALVSDAGTPGMSDPGYDIIHAVIDAGYEVDVLPGANAFVPAVLQSGITPHPCTFFGFLPDKKGERETVLSGLVNNPFTLIFYVSPHKALKHVLSVMEVLGDRKAALVREISKVYQEAIRGNLSDIVARLKEGVKGEMVLVVEGASQVKSDWDWESEALLLREQGNSDREIAVTLSEKGIAKNRVKKWLLSNRKNAV